MKEKAVEMQAAHSDALPDPPDEITENMGGRHQRMVLRALQEARAVPGTYRLGAVIARSGAILATGTNKERNDPAFVDKGWGIHAEVDALRKTKNPQGATLYVIRVTPGEKLALARPCIECHNALVEAGVARVIYTTDTGMLQTYQPAQVDRIRVQKRVWKVKTPGKSRYPSLPVDKVAYIR